MAETIENKMLEEVAVAKPYTFRKLSSKDVFLMFKIISLIGINEFIACLKSESLQEVVQKLMNKGKEKEEGQEEQKDQENMYMIGALAGVLEIANVIFGNLPKCENEIYQLLAQTSDMSIDEIKAEGNAVLFFEMVIDFLKKEEFPDFIKVVSKLFK